MIFLVSSWPWWLHHHYRHYLLHIPIISISLSSWSLLHDDHRDQDDCVPNIVTSSLPLAGPHHHYILIVMIFVPDHARDRDDCVTNVVIIITSLLSLSMACVHHYRDLCCVIFAIMIIASLTLSSSSSLHCYRHYLWHVFIIITLLSPWSLPRHHRDRDDYVNITWLSSWYLSCHRHHDHDDYVTNIIKWLSSFPPACPHHHHIVIVMIFLASSLQSWWLFH